MPKVVEVVKGILGHTPARTINPDEIVAIGAAIQAGVLSGEVTDLLLLDATPLSLGIELEGGIFQRLVSRNTVIPTKTSVVLTTSEDFETPRFNVYQGERELVENNELLGSFAFDGYPPAARGVPRIEITFDVDANSIVHVSAKDLSTNKTHAITIASNSSLSDITIQSKVIDAQKNEDIDRKRKDIVEAANRATDIIYKTKKALTQFEDKLNKFKVDRIREKITVLRETIGKNQRTEGNANGDELKQKTDQLQNAAITLFASMHSSPFMRFRQCLVQLFAGP